MPSLPTFDNLKTMDYAYQAQPFVDVPSRTAVNIMTMDHAYRAQPFVRNYSLIHLFRKVSITSALQRTANITDGLDRKVRVE